MGSTDAMELVTGATGYVGGRLIERLVRDGRPVRALARDPSRLEHVEGVEPVAGDLVRDRGLDAALDGVETAYYLVHSMEPAASANGDYGTRDRLAARNFARAAARRASSGSSTSAGSCRRTRRCRPPRLAARGRADPARGRALLHRAAGVDHRGRALVVVPHPRAPGRAAAAAARSRPGATTARSRSPSATRSSTSRARPPSRPPPAARSTSPGRTCCPTAR